MTRTHEPGIHDGREGLRCPDCGAYLQAARLDGETVFRCPWAVPSSWSLMPDTFITEIYCGRPLGGPRSTSGLYSVAN